VTIRRPWLIVALLLALAAPPAAAHDAPYSWLDLRLSADSLGGKVTAHIVDLAHEASLPAPDSLLDRGYTARHAVTLEHVLATHLRLVADGAQVAPVWTGFEIVPARKAVAFTWRTPWPRLPATLTIGGPLFPYDPLHETYLNVYESGRLRHQDLLDHGRTRYDHYTGSRQGMLAVLRTFLLAGIHHIFIGPDHILFVIGLLLLGGSALRLLKIITAFTLAHSVTLALATLGVVSPPARIIEPLIALSIVVVGVGNLRARAGHGPPAVDARVWAALGFGLIHGFGFASVLRDFGLPREALGVSLFAFNAGVEVGQACIVGAVLPLLALTRARAPKQAPAVVTAISVVVVLAGAWWFVERVFAAR
jgi:hypothetical protein